MANIRVIRKADTAINVSTSGKSLGVQAGIEEAKCWRLNTGVFPGQGGRLKEIVKYVISITSTDIPCIQEIFITASYY